MFGKFYFFFAIIKEKHEEEQGLTIYFSHPNYLLKEHLEDVYNGVMDLFSNKVINYDLLGIEKNQAKKLLQLISLTHDVGKYSDFFQHHLLKESFENNASIEPFLNDKGNLINQELSNHSFISGVVLYAILTDHFDGIDQHFIYSSTMSVFWHHGQLKSKDYIKQKIKELENKDDFYQHLLTILSHLDLSEYCGLINKHNILDEPLSESSLRESVKKTIIREDNPFQFLTDEHEPVMPNLDLDETIIRNKQFCWLLLSYSFLIYSDKYGAIFKKGIKKQPFRSFDGLVEKYKRINNFDTKTSLNKQREAIYHSVREKADNVSINDRLYQLSMNTGYGKTLTSMGFSFKLKERLKKEKGINSSIIYCMPYTSIIEQNFDVAKGVLKQFKEDLSSNILLKHHYLTKKDYRESLEAYNEDESKFLYETWDSDFVFSTFVQFFETIFSRKNKMLIKFPNIINSIIVIDEVQNIEPKMYMAFESICKMLSDIFHITFVSCSATQPYFEEEFKQLVDNHDHYYQTDRTMMDFSLLRSDSGQLDNKMSLEHFYDHLLDTIKKNKHKNCLIMVNTKKISQELYLSLKQDFPDKDIFLLSNTLIPKHKEERLKAIKTAMKNQKTIVIATQLIEAGVDLDFDIGYRQLSPFPSLIQSIGRINRNFKQNNNAGVMHIFDLDAYSPYDNSLLSYTIDTINHHLENHSLKEHLYLKATNYFFKLIFDFYSKDMSEKYLNLLYNLDFGNMDYKVIEEKTGSISLFVVWDEKAEQLKNQFLTLPKKGFLRKKEFDRFKIDFQQYVISINKQDLKELQKYGITLDDDAQFLFLEQSFCDIRHSNHILYSYEAGIKKVELLDDKKTSIFI